MNRAAAADYQSHLFALQPSGPAWPRDPDSVRGNLYLALASSLAGSHNRALDLIEEADPRATTEMLADWERACGLPDTCSVSAVTLSERRAALVAKLTAGGGQSRRFYIDLAATLGFPVTITEFRPFTCDTPITEPVHDEAWRFAWRVNAPETTVREFTAMSGCAEPLATWGNELLECAIRRASPAHTHVLFGYGA